MKFSQQYIRDVSKEESHKFEVSVHSLSVQTHGQFTDLPPDQRERIQRALQAAAEDIDAILCK